ncbi:MFS transporter [Cohnella sp. WQ 127256]|uniref:MFS transporter n=1 Tax=Cohnella sp. WQ 127256 TaxID=2938790 RepID=UPI00211790D7|nr:MFS transporter [Cohnella sp. WQ 127256]
MLKPQPSINHPGHLDRQTWLLLAVNGLFIMASALSGTYFGVYIWKASNDYIQIGWFTLLSHLFMAITFWVAGNGVKEGNKMIYLRLGIGVSALFYALVLLLGGHALQWIWVLGIVQGIATGLFWLSYNVIYFEVTDAHNRDRYNGWAGVIASLVGMIIPWCSGFLISRMAGESGYRAIFILSFVIFVAGIGVSFFLHNRRTEGHYDWKLPYRLLGKPKTAWRPVLGALVAQGVRESVFGVIIGVLIYVQTGSELKLGNYALITSVVGFISFLATGIWLKPAWRNKGMLVGVIAITMVILPFFFGISFTTLLIFGVGAALFFPLYMLPMTSAVFDLIGQDENSVRQRVEYVVARELALNVGRIVGMAIFMVTLSISRAPIVLNSLLLLVGSSPILSWLFMRNVLVSGRRGKNKIDAKPKGVV